MTEATTPPAGAAGSGKGSSRSTLFTSSVPLQAEGFAAGTAATLTRQGIALTVLLLAAAAVRLYRLDALPLWFDENATLAYAHGSVFDVWGEDTHPPLYYSLIALWRGLGESEYVLRLSSVVPSVATVWVVWRCGAAIGGQSTALLAAVLQALSPFAIAYAQDLRMYPLLEFSVALALLGLLRLLRDPERAAAVSLLRAEPEDAASVRGAWLLYGGGTLLALYLHNMGFLWPLAANAATLALWVLRPERKVLLRRWLAVNLCVLALWLPWIPTLLQQLDVVVETFWATQPDLHAVLASLAQLSFGLWPPIAGWAVLLALGLLLLAAWGCCLLRPRALALLLVTVALLPPLLAWGLGWVMRPLFLPRTLIWTALPAVLASAHALAWLLQARPQGGLGSRQAAGVALLLVVVSVRMTGLSDHLAQRSYPDWRRLMHTLAWEVRPQDRIEVNTSWHALDFNQYALRQEGEGRPTPPEARGFDRVKGLVERAKAMAPGDRLWVIRVKRYILGIELPLSDVRIAKPSPVLTLTAEMPCLAVTQRLEAAELEATLLVNRGGC